MIRRTERLILRPFEDRDRAPFAALNADPEVMAEFPAPLTRAESDAMIDRVEAKRAEDGFCFDAVEVDGRFVGFCGLSVPGYDLLFQPCVEVGWRLARAAWGAGYASEAARDALDRAFGDLGLREVVSFTPTTNLRSMAVMERIGMIRDEAADFDHPAIPEGHRLRRHVLYRIAPDQSRRGST